SDDIYGGRIVLPGLDDNFRRMARINCDSAGLGSAMARMACVLCPRRVWILYHWHGGRCGSDCRDAATGSKTRAWHCPQVSEQDQAII
ncbi:hypothetical protein DFQ27_008075, partial [Actinomortierella ambigua]